MLEIIVFGYHYNWFGLQLSLQCTTFELLTEISWVERQKHLYSSNTYTAVVVSSKDGNYPTLQPLELSLSDVFLEIKTGFKISCFIPGPAS